MEENDDYCIKNVPPLQFFLPLFARGFTTYCMEMYQNNKYHKRGGFENELYSPC